MSQEVRNLEPKIVWNHFADLNAVPRPSKKEERIIQFMVDFGKQLNLETKVDEVGNVIIKKPATSGMENRKKVVLQGHLDMVHQKNANTIFDFEKQGIEMFVDGDWVKAKGTTLGADNGLGVAAIMAVLSSNDIPHPAIEALFTIDEETGMTGAMGLKPDVLKGDILLNLDTEEDDEIGIGCAGGVDVTASKTYEAEKTPKNYISLEISVTGLQGGHSGMDIHKGLGNANKIMNALLNRTYDIFGVRISEIKGGSLRNAIPRESFAKVALPKENIEDFKKFFVHAVEQQKKLYKETDPKLSIIFKEIDDLETVIDIDNQEKLTEALQHTFDGVYRMSPDFEDLVETSNNIAKVTVADNKMIIECLTRSSVEEGKMKLANLIKNKIENFGFEVTFSGEYPGWSPNINSSILQVLESTYKRLFNEQPNVAACHAGLECGILGQNYPEMEMISFGPNIKGAHSPDERAQISSTQKFWKLLKEVLANIPEK